MEQAAQITVEASHNHLRVRRASRDATCPLLAVNGTPLDLGRPVSGHLTIELVAVARNERHGLELEEAANSPATAADPLLLA